MVTAMFVTLPRAAASADRINEVLDVTPEVNDPAFARLRSAAGRRPRGHVEFQNVTFQYPGAEEPALSGVSFTAQAGRSDGDHRRHRLRQVDARRTDSALLRRQRRPRAGRRRRRARDAARRTCAPGSAIVPQKAVLFSGTIASNIRFGREAATDDEMQAGGDGGAGRRVHRPEAGGLCGAGRRRAAPTSRAGRSSGWRSRARSCATPRSTSSTTASRRSTSPPTRGCARRSRPRPATATVFIVSQRIGTVMNADRIIVLDDGRVVGHRHARGAARRRATSTARSPSRRRRSRRSHELRTRRA